jgi:hypothetical protein
MKMQVEYEDETTVVYKIKPRHLLALEEKFGGMDESVKSGFTLAHLASGSPLSFEDWMLVVDDITPVMKEGSEVPAAEVPTE